jgi:hypothetical protein
MINKKELIDALAFAEHKISLQNRKELQRQVFIQAIIVTAVARALQIV